MPRAVLGPPNSMWTWSLTWGEVTPDIVVGSCPMTTADVGRLRHEAGASALLSLQHDDCLAYWGIDYRDMHAMGSTLGIAMERCQIRDFDISDMRLRLPRAVHKLARLLNAGHRVYVHCTAGMGRSPLTVWAYLAVIDGQEPWEALRKIKLARPEAVPSPEAFEGFRQDMAARHHDRIARRAYDLYLQGAHPGNAEEDWRQAEAQVVRQALLDDASGPETFHP